MVSFFKRKHGSAPSTPTTPNSVASSKASKDEKKPLDNRQSSFFQRPSTSRAPPPTPRTKGPNITELVNRFPVPAPPNPHEDPAGYLRSIHAVRERTRLISGKVRTDELKHFRVDMDKFPDTTEYVTAIIKVGFSDNGGSAIVNVD